MIDDTAKGLDAGISFRLIDDAALDEVMSKPWHGKRFSTRIWDNTDRLAKEAQEIVGRYIVSGRSLNKAAEELAGAFEAEKFHATTLIHTEVAHARSMSDARAYEEIGAEYYRYMATLDEVTCDVCGPLDGQMFRLDERAEGKNYPVMHPRCRCTTTFKLDWKQRSARNMVTGRNEKIDGSVTYEQWRNGMTNEEKAAFDKAQRKYRKKHEKKVDKSAKRDIIKSGSGAMALENQRYGRNKDTLVNKTYIDGGEYRRKFDGISDNKNVNKTLYECAKTALKHRSGTKFEDMYWVDGNTGEVVASALDEKYESGIINSEKRNKMLSGYDNIYALHTHPASMPPSVADFNSCCKNGYRRGLIACHDGKVFAYTAEEIMNDKMYNLYVLEYIDKGFTEFEAQVKAINEIKRNCAIDFWEVK